MCLKKTGSHMSTSSTSGIHVGIHGEQLPNALQCHYLLFATLASRGDYVPIGPGTRPLLPPFLRILLIISLYNVSIRSSRYLRFSVEIVLKNDCDVGRWSEMHNFLHEASSLCVKT